MSKKRCGSKEVKEFVKKMEDDGWKLVRDHKHFILRKKRYSEVLKKTIVATVVVSKTPGDRRSLRNSYRDACVRLRHGESIPMQAM